MATNPKTGSEEFGELLRRGRERLGMSRRDLVEATGLSYPYVSQLETGYRQPSPTAIRKLADALQLSLDDLFSAMGRGRRDELSASAERDSTTRWVRNASFSGGGGGVAAAPRAFGRPAAAAMHTGSRATQDGAPARLRGHAGSPAEPAPVAVEEHYLMPPAPQEIDADAVVDQVVDLISALPAAVRLETLARLQAEIVQSVIDDGIREGLEG